VVAWAVVLVIVEVVVVNFISFMIAEPGARDGGQAQGLAGRERTRRYSREPRVAWAIKWKERSEALNRRTTKRLWEP
jgi:hypothetical protein